MKKSYVFWLVVATVGAYVLCAVYSWFGDAELRYWKEVGRRKLKHAQSLSGQEPGNLIFMGGSSCTFSIRPDVLREGGFQAVNMGMAAGMGPQFLASFGSSVVDSNDVLVVSLEPNTLTTKFREATGLGIRIAAILGNPDWAVGGDLLGQHLPVREQMAAVRPGGRHVVTMLFKALLGRPMYRYSVDETGEGGWCFTTYLPEKPRPLSGITGELELSVDGRALIAAIAAYAAQRGASVYYLCPWQLTRPESVRGNQAKNEHFLEQISEFMPIIDDGYGGCNTNQEWFADTSYHLTPDGARARTEACLMSLAPLLESQVP